LRKETDYLKRTATALYLVTSSGYELRYSSILKTVYGSKASLESSDFWQLLRKFTSYKHFCHYILHPAMKTEYLPCISTIYLRYGNPCKAAKYYTNLVLLS
jgi:hypothetical protein